MKKIISLTLALLFILAALTGCSKPPEYSEIEGRLKELIEASYGVNDILFGEGLPVYERVYEHEIKVYRDKTDNKTHYYYEINDAELGRMIGYKYTESLYFVASETEKVGETAVYENNGKYYYPIVYEEKELDEDGKEIEKTVSSYKDEESGVTYHFYVIKDKKHGEVYKYNDQRVKYLKVSGERKSESDLEFTDETSGKTYYISEVEYSEPSYDFYYSEDDPAGYSYVRADAKFVSVEGIKEYAESVYSAEYLAGVYEMLFTGAVVSEEDISGRLGARYYNYQDEDGTVWLMESDEYDSLIKGKRIYDFSTAKVVRPGSKKYANIEIESYLEGQESQRLTVKLTLIKQDDGNWYLDTATY
ncbi:MAG: hypothetical protein E7641_04595 [Ruminococcaceae bacterium]|nr:hypothetical protein [Oscillospiraceae bacterium]